MDQISNFLFGPPPTPPLRFDPEQSRLAGQYVDNKILIGIAGEHLEPGDVLELDYIEGRIWKWRGSGF